MNTYKKYKAESMDILQYLYRPIHEPLMHCMVHFDGHVDEQCLQKAVLLSSKTVPQLFCGFDDTASPPCWFEKGVTENFITVVEALANYDNQISDILAAPVNITDGPQIRIFIVRGFMSDIMCVNLNHMVCDGIGFKEYLYLLSHLYTLCYEGRENTAQLISYPRSINILFQSLSRQEKIEILKHKNKTQFQMNPPIIPYEGNTRTPLFISRYVGKDSFDSMKEYAKKHNATVNDMIMAAYTRVIRNLTNKETFVLPCPIDLRRYLPPGKKAPYCNLTGNFYCYINIKPKDVFHETLSQISMQTEKVKKGKSCLKTVLTHEYIVRSLPYPALKLYFAQYFHKPITTYSNLGVIESRLLQFGRLNATYAYISSAIKHTPYFQLTTSTYNGCCTLSTNIFGGESDKKSIETFLDAIFTEMLF